jgi:hypothetical protein
MSIDRGGSDGFGRMGVLAASMAMTGVCKGNGHIGF